MRGEHEMIIETVLRARVSMRRKRSGILWEIQPRTKKKCTPATDGSRLLRREKQWKCSAYKCKDFPGRDFPGRDFPGRDFPGRDFHARDLKGQHSSLACSSMFCGLCKRSWDILLPRHRAKGSFLPQIAKSSFRFTKRYSAVRVCLCRIPSKKRKKRMKSFFSGMEVLTKLPVVYGRIPDFFSVVVLVSRELSGTSK